MSDQIHHAVSSDGTRIAGRVTGRGPPLVLAHGGADDGEFSWGAMLPRLEERFTCYVPSMRGRGLSEDSDDHRPERHVEDLAAVEAAAEATEEGRLATAARAFLGQSGFCNDREMAALDEADAFEEIGQHMPLALRVMEQAPGIGAWGSRSAGPGSWSASGDSWRWGAADRRGGGGAPLRTSPPSPLQRSRCRRKNSAIRR